MRYLLLLFVLLINQTQLFSQRMEPLVIEAKAGEIITLVIENADPADSFNIYRKTGVTSAPALMDSIPAQPDVYTYEWEYKMPGGATPQYRFWVAVRRNGILEGESNVVRVKRVK